VTGFVIFGETDEKKTRNREAVKNFLTLE